MKARAINSIQDVVRFLYEYADFFAAPFFKSEIIMKLANENKRFSDLSASFDLAFTHEALDALTEKEMGRVPANFYTHRNRQYQSLSEFEQTLASIKMQYQNAILNLTQGHGKLLEAFLEKHRVILLFIAKNAAELERHAKLWHANIVSEENGRALKECLDKVETDLPYYERYFSNASEKRPFLTLIWNEANKVNRMMPSHLYKIKVMAIVEKHFSSLKASKASTSVLSMYPFVMYQPNAALGGHDNPKQDAKSQMVIKR
ncbi:hypothetical protein [Aquicella lusitana]|uniref:Uncharacterized protein n=1 Tax=Aquicella lusitana TaxID=254246 RepID=A0A370GS88_9COXI|nr:hypothetical protein [Aquicella lusitana]RDI46568.1 hypothetical protein C8D86_10592 [Aquicella lusitana]VVC74232.1 hypothetical protein AQULUS_19970 [Aquicella lusitana]